MRVFRRRSKNALLAKSLPHGFPAFCLPKRKAPAGYAGANFHLMKLQIYLTGSLVSFTFVRVGIASSSLVLSAICFSIAAIFFTKQTVNAAENPAALPMAPMSRLFVKA